MSFWKEKRVWVVGASSGIGEGLVEVLARSGAKLLISSRNEKRLNFIAEKFSSSDIHVLEMDVADHSLLK